MITEFIAVRGRAGAGKTKYIMDTMVDYVKYAVYKPSEIAYLSYTKAAVEEGAERIIELGFNDLKDIHGFRTLHSLCFRLLKLKPFQIMQYQDYRKVCDQLGLRLRFEQIWKTREDAHTFYNPDSAEGNQFISIYDYHRNSLKELEFTVGLSLGRYQQFVEILENYKAENTMLDFTDFLQVILTKNIVTDFKVIFVDEYQDITPLAAKAIDHICVTSEIETAFLVGDEAQTIYEFSGTTPDTFLQHPTIEEIDLNESHRIPAKLIGYVNSVFNRIENKKPATLTTSSKIEGQIEYLSHRNQILQYLTQIPKTESIFILHRHIYGCKALGDFLLQNNILFKNTRGVSPLESLEHIAFRSRWQYKQSQTLFTSGLQAILKLTKADTAIMKRGTKTATMLLKKIQSFSYPALLEAGFKPEFFELLLNAPATLFSSADKDLMKFFLNQPDSIYENTPNITISTIHGVKGQEADHVFVFNEFSQRTWKEFAKNQDSEHRVFYVAVSRTKKNLYIVKSHSPFIYPL